jgi:predicted GIY-YIG superfamily endonuclease
MDSRFAELVSVMDEKADVLLSMNPVTRGNLPPPQQIPVSGVYLFSEGDAHLYVGRTRRLRRRLIEHSSPQLLDAPFAFRLARQEVGKTVATYTKQDSRRTLRTDPTFRAAYRSAIDRIRSMDIRYVEEADPVRQALLEIYVSVVTQSPYNEFKTT